MSKNYVCCTPYLSKHTSCDCVFCSTSLKWWHLQMLPFSQNFSFLGCYRGEGVKGKKWPKMTKKILTLYIRNCTSWLWFLVHICKMMISSAIFFSFFQNSDFLGFSKFINKCQKEILRCAPPSSHECDFLQKHFIKESTNPSFQHCFKWKEGWL